MLIVDADSGKVIGQVRVGPMAGSAIEPLTGHVFTGNGEDDSSKAVGVLVGFVLRGGNDRENEGLGSESGGGVAGVGTGEEAKDRLRKPAAHA